MNTIQNLNLMLTRPHVILAKTIGEWSVYILGYPNTIILWMIVNSGGKRRWNYRVLKYSILHNINYSTLIENYCIRQYFT